MSPIPEPNQAAPIGKFVRAHLPQILAYCEQNPEEFNNLQDKDYCLATLRQSYAVLTPKTSEDRPPKYWAAKSSAPFTGAGYWVTSEWVARLHTAHFVTYLVRLGIQPAGVDDDFIAWAEETVDAFGTTGKAPGGPRYRATPVGVVQNSLVRHLLGSLAFDAFTKADWVQVKEAGFGGACAYCGAVTSTTMDHVIPINRQHLGEHRLGNLAPACSSCNGKKSQATYTDFLRARFRDDPSLAEERIAALAEHAVNHGYVPIEDLDGVVSLVEEARARVKELADEYRERINRQIEMARGRV